MDQRPSLLEATRYMNFELIKQLVAADPKCVHEVDSFNNNAMHLLVKGAGVIRARHIMEFFLTETEIDLHKKNAGGLDPLELATAVGDEAAADMVEPYWQEQLNRKFPDDAEPKISVVPSKSRPGDPQP